MTKLRIAFELSFNFEIITNNCKVRKVSQKGGLEDRGVFMSSWEICFYLSILYEEGNLLKLVCFRGFF